MVKVFSLSPLIPTNSSELGQFTGFIHILGDGSTGNYEFSADRLVRVDVYGWQTPMPQALGPLQVQPLPATQEQKNLELIVATLVNMLGGAVTVSPEEVERAVKFELTMFKQDAPTLLTITVEEKK